MANKSGASLPEPAAPAEDGAKKEADAGAAPAAQAAAPAPAAAAPAAAAPAAAAQAPAPEQKTAAVNPAGEQLYKTVCFACHATGVANAPVV